MTKYAIPKIGVIYEVNTDYHPYNLDNCLKPGDWPTAKILEINDDSVLIQWLTADQASQPPEWISIIYFTSDIPMLIEALGL